MQTAVVKPGLRSWALDTRYTCRRQTPQACEGLFGWWRHRTQKIDFYFLRVELNIHPFVPGTNLHRKALKIFKCALEGLVHDSLLSCEQDCFSFHLASAEAAGLFHSGSGDELQIKWILHLNHTTFFFF